jgi:hypothetical protein
MSKPVIANQSPLHGQILQQLLSQNGIKLDDSMQKVLHDLQRNGQHQQQASLNPEAKPVQDSQLNQQLKINQGSPSGMPSAVQR